MFQPLSYRRFWIVANNTLKKLIYRIQNCLDVIILSRGEGIGRRGAMKTMNFRLQKFRRTSIQCVIRSQVIAAHKRGQATCPCCTNSLGIGGHGAWNSVHFDEATFHISGRVKKHNCVMRMAEDPKEVWEEIRDSNKVYVRCAVSKFGATGLLFSKEQTF